MCDSAENEKPGIHVGGESYATMSDCSPVGSGMATRQPFVPGDLPHLPHVSAITDDPTTERYILCIRVTGTLRRDFTDMRFAAHHILMMPYDSSSIADGGL